MKTTYENPYQSSDLQRLHKIVDEADPFLIESLNDKDESGLIDALEKAEKNYQIAIKGSSRETINYAEKTTRTIVAMIELKKVKENIKRDLASDKEGEGGYSLL